MATNLAINDHLLNNALTIGGLKTKKDTVNLALEEFIQNRQRKNFLSLVNSIDFDEDWDYRKLRGKK